MSVLAIPHGTEGVRQYRFSNAARYLPVTQYDKYIPGTVMKDVLVPWLSEHGFDWDSVWTGDYSDEMQALLGAMRERGSAIVADIDDYFEEVPPGNISMPSWFGPRRRLYKELLSTADRVAASTPYLAEMYSGVVAPNFIVPEDWEWQGRPSKRPDECVVLHACGTGRAGDFMERADEFEALLAMPHVKFVFMGAMPKWALRYDPGRVVWCRWVPIAEYPRMLRWIAPDVVVSPMQHHKFNLAKSNIKWLEASMCGAVFVGERWGEYERTVVDGETGVLAVGAAEWKERMVELTTNVLLRRRLAAAGAAAVLSGWTWQTVGPAWRKAILGVSEDGSSSSNDSR